MVSPSLIQALGQKIRQSCRLYTLLGPGNIVAASSELDAPILRIKHGIACPGISVPGLFPGRAVGLSIHGSYCNRSGESYRAEAATGAGTAASWEPSGWSCSLHLVPLGKQASADFGGGQRNQGGFSSSSGPGKAGTHALHFGIQKLLRRLQYSYSRYFP